MSNASYVETDCIFEHTGRKFESGGAVITPDYIVCYPRSDGKVCDWHGNVLSEAFVLSSWRTPRSFLAAWMYSFAVYIQGVRYVGRGAGNGMILRAKRSSRQDR